jgi:DNA repair protein RadC
MSAGHDATPDREERGPSWLIRHISFYGTRDLADSELLRVLLSGTHERRRAVAERLLWDGKTMRELARAGFATLSAHGLSEAEAARLKACFELGRRAVADPPHERAVSTPHDAFRCVARCFAGEDRERLVVVVLDTKNRPRHVSTVAVGSVDLCPVDPREVFGAALRERGSAVIIAHNHPSGDPNPSPEDVALTTRLAQAGAILGMPVLDHIIVGNANGTFVSLAERGLVPTGKRAA